ncbi:hypothetical protein FQZ97_1119850 [compost metagenome]
MITVAMTLDIAEPEVEVHRQPLQQRRIGPAAEAVAVEEVQQRFAGGRRVPATQGESGGRSVGPGEQLHRTCLDLTAPKCIS